MASLRREFDTVFPQCFHTGHNSKLDKQWVYIHQYKRKGWERIIFNRNDGYKFSHIRYSTYQ